MNVHCPEKMEERLDTNCYKLLFRHVTIFLLCFNQQLEQGCNANDLDIIRSLRIDV